MSEADPYKQIEELKLENRLLRAENKRLQQALGLPSADDILEKSMPFCETEENKVGYFITKHSPPEEKIALFMSLFRGRTDVYAKRCYSKKYMSSYYTPVCKNEWLKQRLVKLKIFLLLHDFGDLYTVVC